MKQKSIASICKPAVTLLAAAAIILLCRKGIIPVYTILLLTMAEGIIRILLRLLPFLATNEMETRKFTPSAPVAPALWPTTRSIRPAKRRFPNTVDEPRNIGYYLKPLLDITKRPDRDEILKTYLKETYV